MAAKGRTYDVFHLLPVRGMYADYILLPLGYRMNRDILEAKEGSCIRFGDGRKRYAIVSKGVIPLTCSGINGLCYARYGIDIRRVMKHWENNALSCGYGVHSVSKEECLIVFYVEEGIGQGIEEEIPR